MTSYIVAIDQGTTSTRSIIFNDQLKIVASSQKEFTQHFPQSGWVEHDPHDLIQTTLETLQQAVQQAGIAVDDIKGVGVTNQRETVVVWNKHTGESIYNAIVWQDRRTADSCQVLKEQGKESLVQEKTGLLLDPYFSASKVRWLLTHIEGARTLAEQGDLLLGTVDTWLIWNLTKGQVHATDATNASRTMLYNIHEGAWDDELLALFDIPRSMLPEVKDCAADFGCVDASVLGQAIPITGVAGDQQAALVGQACFAKGMMKATYGTGCFALLNTGEQAIASKNKLLTTIGYQLDGKPSYALEGSIFMAGAAVQWLRDGLGIIDQAKETQALAEKADPSQAVYLVPAFVGLGAPYWNAQARGALFGLTRNTGAAEIAKATLESIGYQTRDLLEAMQADGAYIKDTVLRVDGGMSASDWTMQFLANILHTSVERARVLETTALGAAYLAGLKLGLFIQPELFMGEWEGGLEFMPQMSEGERKEKYDGWKNVVYKLIDH